MLISLLLFGPAARHADENEEEKHNRGSKTDHDGFAMDAKVGVFIGIGGCVALCSCCGRWDERCSECCSRHGIFGV
jgi:hypothetical protein